MFPRTLGLSNVTAALVSFALIGTPALNAASPTFTQIKKLQPDDAGVDDRFGADQDSGIDGDTLVVGAHLADSGAPDAGAAYVFHRNEGGRNNWGLVKKLQVDNPQFGNRFGSPSISGNTIVVGEFGNDTGGSNAGAAYVFGRHEGGNINWGLIKKLRPDDLEAGDQFGVDAAVSGDTVVVGAFGADTGDTDAGAAYVFKRKKGGKNNWGLVKKLQASDPEAGDQFGVAVSISADTIVVGALGEDTGSFDAGAVYVFQRNEGGKNNWGQVKKLQANQPVSQAWFGWHTSIDRDTIIVGANREGVSDAGAAYIFQRNEGGKDNWGLVKRLEAGAPGSGGRFGRGAISGDRVVVGAFKESAAGSESGAAYVFGRNEGGKDNWGQIQKLLPDDLSAGDQFGSSVAISGGTLFVGKQIPAASEEAVYVFSTPGTTDALGDAPPTIDTILAHSSQAGSEFICTLAIASGDQGLIKKSQYRCHLSFGNLGFGPNATMIYQVKKTKRRCKGMPGLTCTEEEMDLDGNNDTTCDGDVGGRPAQACLITLRGDVQDITDRWLAACAGNDCLTPFPGSGVIDEYDVQTFWSTKRKKDFDRVPDTDDDQEPDSAHEVVVTRLTN